MSNNDAITTEYNSYQAQRHGSAHARRTADVHGAFILPHLKPGMGLLDVGCGPGSITLGLAQRVAAGEVVGIDISAGRIEQARALAAERGVTNVRFETADIYALPFEDASFDAVFSNAVHQHLSDPLAALREQRRVLKPGGVIGIGDPDLVTSIVYPSTPALERSLDVYCRIREADGGTPDIGRRLREVLHDAGFARVTASAVAGSDGTAETARFMGDWWAAYFEAPAIVARVAAAGIATEAEMAEMGTAWRAWGEAPGAFAVRFGCHAIGWAE